MFVLCWFLQISLSCRVGPMLPVSQFLWIVNSVVLSKVYWYLLGTPMWCVCLLVKVVLLSSNCNCWAFLCNLKSVNVSCSLNMISTLYCYLLFVKLLFVYIVEWPVLHYFARGNIPSVCNVNVNVNLDISCMYN